MVLVNADGAILRDIVIGVKAKVNVINVGPPERSVTRNAARVKERANVFPAKDPGTVSGVKGVASVVNVILNKLMPLLGVRGRSLGVRILFVNKFI